MKAISYNQRNRGQSKTLCLGACRALWNHGELFLYVGEKNMCFRSEIKRLNVVFLPPRIYAFKNFFSSKIASCFPKLPLSWIYFLLGPFSQLEGWRAGWRGCGLWKWVALGQNPHPSSCSSSRKSLHFSKSWFLICTKGLFRSWFSTHQLCDLE